MGLTSSNYETLRNNISDAFNDATFAELVRFRMGLDWSKVVPISEAFPHKVFLFIQ